MAKYYLPGIGGQINRNNDDSSPYQVSPMLNTYSPRLFGAPQQLTHLNDMRLLSAPDESHYGPVGDFYLTKILQDAQICNFSIGRAVFTGGMSSVANIFRVAAQYAVAMHRYDIYGTNNSEVKNNNTVNSVMQEANIETYKNKLGEVEEEFQITTAGTAGLTGLDEDTTVLDTESMGVKDLLASLGDMFVKGGALLTADILTSLSVQQPFYTFESDWFTHMNNVKTMINTAVIMLGLQKAPVRIGDCLYPIGMDVNVKKDNDVWSNYRYITPTSGLGDVTGIDTLSGDTSQYVSFMIDSSSVSESYTNNVGDSQLFSNVMNSGSSYGAELAFLTNSSIGKVDDFLINKLGDATNIAQRLVSSLTGGIGRFTAAITGSMARSYLGDHTIYPQVYQSSSSSSSMTFTIHLTSDGDPYSFLINILVPLFHLFDMAWPRLSKNNASAYQYPPIIQANIPGMWGTRLGMVTSLTVTKNPNGKDVSINGYPLSVDVSVTITDLQHVMVTSPMNQVSCFLNNDTMFDYIAQTCGCDKYRVNPAIRLVSKLALASSAVTNTFNTLGDALMNEVNAFANRMSGVYRV